ncbi:MAG: GAF domain-containing protein [Candidatus Delongbacteria bacterium]
MPEPGVDLRRLLQRALDSLLAGGQPSDLELVLLRSDHALRAQDGLIRDLRQSLGEHIDELQAQLDQLAALRGVGALLAAWTDSESLFDRLPGELRRLFGADSVSLYLLDMEHQQLEIVGADPADEPRNTRALPLERGTAGWVVRHGRGRLVPDCRLDPVFLELAPSEDAPFRTPGCLLCAPLQVGGQVLGVVNVSHAEPGRLDARDENLLGLLAPFMAQALARTRLQDGFRLRLGEQTRELQDVREFFQSIINSSDDLIVVLSPDYEMILISTVLERLLGVPVGRLLNQPVEHELLDEATGAELRGLLGQGECLRDRDVLLHHADGRDLHASLNASPILGPAGERLGHLCIFRSIERRMRTHHELTRLNTRLNLLFEAAVDLGSSLDLPQVLERSLAWIHRLIEADEASLLLLSPDGRSLTRLRAGQPPEEGIALGECPEGLVVSQLKPLLLAEPAAVRQFLPEAGGRLQSCIMVPMRVQDSVLGILRVDSHNPDRLFTHQDLRLCSTFTNQAALSIENSRLYAATRRESSRLLGLLDLSRRIRDLRTSQAILAQFGQTALDLAGVQAVVAWEYRRNEHQLRRACLLGKDLSLEPGESVLPASLPGDDPLPYLLGNRERRLRYKPLPEQLPPWAPAVRGRAGAASLLAVPVMDEGEVYGLLLVYGDERHPPLEEEESFISVLALQAAAAIHSQRLLMENQTAREFLTSVVTSATDAIVVTDRVGRITLFNPGAESMLGLSATDMVGRHAPALYPEAGALLTDMRRAMRQGQDHLTFETNLRARDGRQVPVQLSLSWMRDARNRITGVLGVAKDIRELKKLEQTRLEAERLSGIERMAVTVSDKINTPLSVILAQLDMVRLLQKDLGPGALEALQSVENQVVVIKAILDQLNELKHARIKAYALPNVHMYDLEQAERAQPEAAARPEAPLRDESPGREPGAAEPDLHARPLPRPLRRKAPHGRGRSDPS